MADYIPILDTQVEPKAPVTSELMFQLRDNPVAISEGKGQIMVTGWHPFDKTDIDGTEDGEIYSFGADGGVSSLVTPTFADGWEYMIWATGIVVSGGGTTLLAIQNADTDAWLNMGNLDSGDDYSLQVSLPKVPGANHPIIVFAAGDQYTTASPPSPPDRIKAIRLTFSPTTTAGKVQMFRRREYISG